MGLGLGSLICCVGILLLSGCQTAKSGGEERFTVASVQQSIREGMSDEAVVAALGAPNLITHENGGGEVWVYDRIYARADSSTTGTTLYLVLFGVGQELSSSVRESRALTVMIYFDSTMHVKWFTYRSAAF